MKKYIIYLCVIFLSCSFILGCSSEKEDPNIVKVVYWEKWTDFEGEAMQDEVCEFKFESKLEIKELC